MRLLLSILCLFLFSCGGEPEIPPTQAQLDAITSELNSWGEDRWHNWKVSYLRNDETILVRIAIDPMANEIAMDGYIDIVKKEIKKHARKYDATIRLLKYGEIVKYGFVRGSK